MNKPEGLVGCPCEEAAGHDQRGGDGGGCLDELAAGGGGHVGSLGMAQEKRRSCMRQGSFGIVTLAAKWRPQFSAGTSTKERSIRHASISKSIQEISGPKNGQAGTRVTVSRRRLG